MPVTTGWQSVDPLLQHLGTIADRGSNFDIFGPLANHPPTPQGGKALLQDFGDLSLIEQLYHDPVPFSSLKAEGDLAENLTQLANLVKSPLGDGYDGAIFCSEFVFRTVIAASSAFRFAWTRMWL